ncbi:DUF4412 domain-containing protein [Portibacter lacus]|uniref:DUF4412 domain-containing protein n=1 Tax=Portibacter lacus TaxID=1099794 RepID=A0AA37SP15_9BACT|nr:DUF4412 domain-containing protein [Portibacter lacus]GLR16509.1 hypothetical protein GCM10007940_11240 [Portibacter lacus]
MKRISLLFLAISFLSTFALQAQKELKEGLIKYEVTDVKSDDPQMAAQLGMMKGTTNDVYFMKGKSLTKMNMMGGMMKMSMFSNSDDNTGVMLFDAMGQKYMIPMSADEKAANKEKSEEAMGDLEFIYDRDDKKTIAGYDCYKVTLKSDKMQGVEMSAYITKDITSTAEVMQGIDANKLEGFPLEYTVSQGGQFSMVFTALEVNDDIDTEVFNLDTKGFKEMTMEEFQSAMGGGMMGF